MDAATKKRFFLIVIFAGLAQISFFLFILTHNTFTTTTTLRIISGSFSIIAGIVFIYNTALFSFLKEKDKILKYSMIANPGVVIIFAGIGMLFWDQKRFFVLFLIFILGAVISFLIGLILLYFWKYGKQD